MGFNEYLNHIRLEQARMLLKGHDMKVKDIAHACGFADSNYFCRLFRKTTERSPSEYRRQYHSQLTEKTSPVKTRFLCVKPDFCARYSYLPSQPAPINVI